MRDTAITGDVHLDGRPTKITLDLQQLSSDQPRRDNFIRQMFRAHPAAVLTVPSIANLPARYEVGQTVKQQVSGTLAINGVERPITFDVEARLDGRRVALQPAGGSGRFLGLRGCRRERRNGRMPQGWPTGSILGAPVRIVLVSAACQADPMTTSAA